MTPPLRRERLTTDEAAAITGLSTRLIQKLCQTGKLPRRHTHHCIISVIVFSCIARVTRYI